VRRDEAIALTRAQLPELRQRFGVRQLAVFGSVARDEATAASDESTACAPVRGVLLGTLSVTAVRAQAALGAVRARFLGAGGAESRASTSAASRREALDPTAGLDDVGEVQPPLDADLFIAAGSVAAERAARERAARADLERILRRAIEQAATLRAGNQ